MSGNRTDVGDGIARFCSEQHAGGWVCTVAVTCDSEQCRVAGGLEHDPGLCTVAVTCDSEQCRVAGGLEHDPGTWKI